MEPVVTIVMIAVRPTYMGMITVTMMLISSTVTIILRYMDIIGFSSSIQPCLIIDWERSRLTEAHGSSAYTPYGKPSCHT